MIPLSIPNIGPEERQAVDQALADGWISTAGPAVKAFEQSLCDLTGSGFAVATNSGTSAIHLALQVLGIGPGDLVLAPDLTFVASVNPILYQGAEPVLVDCRPDTWQMDPELVAAFLEQECKMEEGACLHLASGRPVKAILAVHVLGYPCEIERLGELAKKHGLYVVEDAAESVGSKLNGRALGTFGDVGCLSFNGNKIVSSGSGGAVLTSQRGLAEHAKHLSLQAKRHAEEYLHDEVGYNYRMGNLAAALGGAQLARLPEFLDRKRAIFNRYREALQGISELNFISFDESQEVNHWLTTISHPQVRSLEEILAIQKIQTRKLWLPMQQLPQFEHCQVLGEEKHSLTVYKNSLSLPCSTGLSTEDQEQVIAALLDFFH